MSIFEQLQNKFKKIFLLNLTTRKDRLDTMFDQLFYFGLPEDYQQADLDIKFTVPFLKYNILLESSLMIPVIVLLILRSSGSKYLKTLCQSSYNFW